MDGDTDGVGSEGKKGKHHNLILLFVLLFVLLFEL